MEEYCKLICTTDGLAGSVTALNGNKYYFYSLSAKHYSLLQLN